MSSPITPSSRYLALLLASALLLILHPVPAVADTPDYRVGGQPILFVFDTSGSMSELDDQSVPKLEGAKSATIDVIYDLPASARVGVWSYPSADDNCGPGTSVLDVNTVDTSLLTAEIQKLQPTGNTPTASALRSATDSLKAQGYASGTIVLVSDGLANCDEDPCEVASAISSEGFDLTVETTGFSIDDEGRKQLECIAAATGGQYADVSNADQLTERLAAVSQAALELEVTGLDSNARAGGAHTISASIHNTNTSVAAQNATLMLSFKKGSGAVFPAVLPPRIQLGNIPPGETLTRSWTISTGQPGNAYALVTAQAFQLNPVQKTGTVSIINKDATLEDAGAILRDAKRIAIIGDSFSSGEGTKNYVDMDTKSAGCHRSFDAYALHLYGVTNDDVLVACSGAVTPQYYSANLDRGRDPQSSYLSGLFSDPDTAPQVVLLTFGGNDIFFADIVKQCAQPWSKLGSLGDCTRDSAYINAAYSNALNIRPTLTKLYENINETILRHTPEAGPRIPLIVLPYVQIITNTIGDGCSNMNNNERQFGVQLLSTLNASVEDAVADARATGVPIYYAKDVTTALLPGHTACADDPRQRYVNSVDLTKTALSAIDLDLAAKCAASGALPYPAAPAICGTQYFAKLGPRASELMHPNSGGHRAITNALVDWSRRPEVESAWSTDKVAPFDTSGILQVGKPFTVPAFTTDATISMLLQPAGTTQVSTGGQLTLQGSGYAPNSQVRVVVRSNPLTLGIATADPSGNVNTTVIIPLDLPRGAHTIELDGYDPEFRPLLLQQPIDVNAYVPRWVVLVGFASLAALAAAAALQLRGRRRRSPQADATAAQG